jgi:hypothetical protein
MLHRLNPLFLLPSGDQKGISLSKACREECNRFSVFAVLSLANRCLLSRFPETAWKKGFFMSEIIERGAVMDCPYCKERIASDALVCKTCRRDIQLVASLNAQLATAQKELEAAKNLELVGTPAADQDLSAVTPMNGGRIEIAAILSAAIFFPCLAYFIRMLFDLDAWVCGVAIFVAAAGAGFLIGFRHPPRLWAWFFEAILLAVLQWSAYALAFGCRMHEFWAGWILGSGKNPTGTVAAHTILQWARLELWRWSSLAYQLAPSLIWFLTMAALGRALGNRKTGPAQTGLTRNLIRPFASQLDHESHAGLEERLANYTKIVQVITQCVSVLFGMALTIYGLATHPPETANGQGVAHTQPYK